MRLDNNDYINIAAMVEEGGNHIEYEKGGETLYIDCTFEVDGYVEDDYDRGTGAFVETDRRLHIESAETMGDGGVLEAADVDEMRLKALVA